MSKNVIMNDEVMDNVAENAAEEVVTTSTGGAAKKAVKVGLVVLAGVVIYKKVLKPIGAKIKANRASKKAAKMESVAANETEPKFIYDENGKPIED